MMALFLLLWILSTTDVSTQASIAQYFRDPGTFETSTSGGGNDLITQYFSQTGVQPAGHGLLPESALEGLQERVRDELQHLKEYNALKDQISLQQTSDGLLIEIKETSGPTRYQLFGLSSATMTPTLSSLLKTVARELQAVPNKIAIAGHTDAHPYRDATFYSNWELSTARALNARRVMEAAGLPPTQIARVTGYAHSAPLLPHDPHHPANRRISILVLRANTATP